MIRPLILAALIAAPAMAAPVTQAPPNVPEKRPAFAGQTRADVGLAKGQQLEGAHTAPGTATVLYCRPLRAMAPRKSADSA